MIGSIARAVGGVVMGILGATGAGKPNDPPNNSAKQMVMAETIKESLSNEDNEEEPNNEINEINKMVAKQIVKPMKFT
jgi:hypothetical protein